MKNLILFCFLILNLVGLTQSNCPYYDKYIRVGDSILKKGDKADFKDAINAYSTAMLHCPDSAQEARKKILEVFKEIEKLKKKAERAEKKSKDALAEAVKAKAETQTALDKANKLIGTFYFYNDRFALAYKDMGMNRSAEMRFGFYFIDKNGDRVNKLGQWEEAGPFKKPGFAKVKRGIYDYIVDTFGRDYPSAYDIKNIESTTLALDLSDKNWDSIPDEVLGYEQLQVLILNGRRFRRNQMTTLPEKIDRLKNLETLQLTFCLIDSLTPQIGKLKNLAILDLSNNRLSFLPPQIDELKNLKSLDLSFNQLSIFPIQIGELGNLTLLYLDGNQLDSLPGQIGKLENLRGLGLLGNKLKSLPKEIGELGNLTMLDLGGNELKNLPLEIVKLKKLMDLNLYGNPIPQPEKEKIRKLLPNCRVLF